MEWPYHIPFTRHPTPVCGLYLLVQVVPERYVSSFPDFLASWCANGHTAVLYFLLLRFQERSRLCDCGY